MERADCAGMSKVLITGATGFIGARCLPLLIAHGCEVVAVSRRDVVAGTRSCIVDLRDRLAVRRLMQVERPTHLLHTAWHPIHGNILGAIENWTWLRASLDLVEEFHAAGGARAALVGSCAEYDWRFGVCGGGTPYVPRSAYGMAKNTLRLSCEFFARSTGLSFVWPRPFFIYGPGEHRSRLVASVIAALLDGNPAETTDGRLIRDYVHVDDVARGIVQSLVSGYSGSVDLASGRPTPLREIIMEIIRQMGRPDLVRLGARSTDPGESVVVIGDARPAFDAIGWTPTFSLEAGIAHTIAAARRVRLAPSHLPQQPSMIMGR